MRRSVAVAAALGLAVPLVFEALYALSGHRYLFGVETALLWPSVFLLFYTDGGEGTWGARFVVVESVLINMILYSLVGAAFGLVVRARARFRRA
jgi:hypothetical protein